MLLVLLSVLLSVVLGYFVPVVSPASDGAFAPSGRPRRYTACAPGRFGGDCSGACACDLSAFDCDDGPDGDGSCECALGMETLCRLLVLNCTTTELGKRRSRSSAPCGRLPKYPETYSEALRDALPPFLASFELDARTLQEMRVDPLTFRRVRQVYNATVSRVRPKAFRAPGLELCALDRAVARELELDMPQPATDGDVRAFNDVFSGRVLLSGSRPFAHAYGGHQFGRWAGQLGDGRAISLGNRLSRWEISLKGAGKTPYSRRGDGRAVLRSLSREYLAGSHLRALGVPSVVALALIGADARNGADAGDYIVRDEYYVGRPELTRSGVLVRVAPSFVRFGSLQLARTRQGRAGLVHLARHVLRVLRVEEEEGDASWRAHFDPAPMAAVFRPASALQDCFFAPAKATPSCSHHNVAADGAGTDVLACLLLRISERLAALVAAWQSVGLAHGVMNTDNLSALGLTIDLNVFGWIGAFRDADRFVPNFIDENARYAFGKQKRIALWNLNRLADAFAGVKQYVADDDGRDMRSEEARRLRAVHAEEEKEEKEGLSFLPLDTARQIVQDAFQPRFDVCFDARLRWRMGLPSDSALNRDIVQSWMAWMRESNADYHLASRALAEFDGDESSIASMAAFLVQASVADVPADGGDTMAEVDANGNAKLNMAAAAAAAAAAAETFLEDFRQALRVEMSAKSVATWEAWQHHVRSVVPRFVMRTSALRKIGEATEDGHSEVLREAWLFLAAKPFLSEAGRSAFLNAGTSTAMSSGKSALLDLAALPGPRERFLQTSCGGQ
jgi:uncharacterized protein YdiU (UPF0061 family)